jgi:hypothetical protein
MCLYAINKQTFEVNCKTEDIAANVTLEIENYTAFQINNIISQVLEEIVSKDTHLAIDKIEIDLEDMDLEAFGNAEMLVNFKNLFSEKILEIYHHENHGNPVINNIGKGISAASAAGSDWELIRSFLLNGDLPWWADKNADIDIDCKLQKLIQFDAGAIKTFLQQHKERLNIAGRLSDQLKPVTRVMINALVPGTVPGSINRKVFQLDHHSYPDGFLLQGALAEKFDYLLGDFQPEAIHKRRDKLLSVLGKIVWQLHELITAPGSTLQVPEMLMAGLMKSLEGRSQKKLKGQLTRYVQRLSVFEIEFLLFQVSLLTDIRSVSNADKVYDEIAHDNSNNAFAGNNKQYRETGNFVMDEVISVGKHDTHLPAHHITSVELPGIDSQEAASNQQPLTTSKVEHDHEARVAEDVALQTEPTFTSGQNFQPVTDNNVMTSRSAVDDKKNNNSHINIIEKKAGINFFNNLENITDRGFDEAIKNDDNFFLELVRLLAYLDYANSEEGYAPTGVKNKSLQRQAGLPTESSPGFTQQVSPEGTGSDGDVFYDDKSRVNNDKITPVTGLQDSVQLQQKGRPVADTESGLKGIKEIIDENNNAASGKQQLEKRAETLTEQPALIERSLKAKKIVFITARMGASDPILFRYLEQLDEAQLEILEKTLREHSREYKKRRKVIKEIVQNPAFLKYEVLKIYANIFLVNERANENAPGHPSIKAEIKRKMLLKDFADKIQLSHASFFLLVDRLSSKEILLLVDIFHKKKVDTEEETGLLRKILYKLPGEAVFLIKFLTELPEKEIMALTSLNRNKLATGLHAGERADMATEDPAPAGNLETNALINGTVTQNQPGEIKNRLSEIFYKESNTGKIYIENAGLCVIALYLRGLFNQLGYLDKGVFKNRPVASRAVYILQYLATGKKKCAEYLLQFNKVLCGFRADDYISSSIRLTKKEIAESDMLLKSVIENWKALKNTSPEGFRESFIQRKGILIEAEQHWTLQVERKGFDLLLNTIPWGFNIIKLPWTKKHIRVEW